MCYDNSVFIILLSLTSDNNHFYCLCKEIFCKNICDSELQINCF